MNEQMKGQLEMMNQQIKELTSIYHAAAGKLGISENELWIWYAVLALGGEYSQQDICDMWSIPKQTVNSIISNLLKKDMILLKTVPGTRNRKIIHLTERGREYGATIISPIHMAEQRALEKLSEKERQNGIALLRKYILLLKGECNEQSKQSEALKGF